MIKHLFFDDNKLFSAIITDGVQFEPEALFDLKEHLEKQFTHEIMDIGGASS